MEPNLFVWHLIITVDATDLLKLGFAGVIQDMVKNVVPFDTVLTLPVNSGAVISYCHGKFPVMSQMTYPKFSIRDPTYTFTLPKIQVANGVVDAFVHVVEQYITFPVDARVQDWWTEGIMKTLIEIVASTVNE